MVQINFLRYSFILKTGTVYFKALTTLVHYTHAVFPGSSNAVKKPGDS